MKKAIWIVVIIVIVGISIGVGCLFLIKNKPTNVVASTIILDINPSIKIDLDKDDNVLFVTPLNEDAKDLVTNDMIGKNVKETVNQISDNLIERRYGDGDLVILVSSKDEGKALLVKETITDNLKEKEVEAKVVSYVIKEDVKTNISGISEGKSALIEDIVNANSDLKVEELKDKSIEELLSYEEQTETPVEKKEEDKKEDKTVDNNQNKQTTKTDTTTKTDNKTNTSTNQKTNNTQKKTYTCTPPTDLKDTEWCNWNRYRPQNCNFVPDTISGDQAMNAAYARYGLSSSGFYLSRYASEDVYSGSSYCRAVYTVIITKQERITTYWDSHTGEFLSEKKEAVPKFIWTEDEALQQGLSHFNLNQEDCKNCWTVTGTWGDGGDDWVYRFEVNMQMQNNDFFSVNYNAVNGSIINERQTHFD